MSQSEQPSVDASKTKPRVGEASFTLFETVIALAIMGAMIVELMSVQGNTIYFNEYATNLNRGIWLANRVMNQVDYYWQSRPFRDLKFEGRDEIPFEDEKDFSYRLRIIDWQLPIVDLLTGGAGASQEGESGDGGEQTEGADAGIGAMIKQQLGDELLKVAHVEVSWPEGAKRNSVTLTYLLTNQKAIDEKLVQFGDTANALDKAESGKSSPVPGGAPPGGQQPGQAPPPGPQTPETAPPSDEEEMPVDE